MIILDVREPDEFATGHVKGARNLPLSQLSQTNPVLTDIPKDAPIITYCRSGQRAGVAQQLLTNWGYTDVSNGINQTTVEAHYF